MLESFCYDVPHALFHDQFVAHICTHSRGRATLVISANAAHARWLKQHALLRNAPHITVRTLQSTLISQLNRLRRHTVVSATARGAIVNLAWQQSDSPLYHRVGARRGAVGEIAQALTWISQQRKRWRDVAHELDTKHELARIYQQYCALMDANNVIGYDDVALHVSDMGVQRQHDVVIACELQYATPAQLHALGSLVDRNCDDWVGAWVHPHHAAAEYQVVYQWLCALHAPRIWQGAAPHAYLLSQRILGHRTATPPLHMIGTAQHGRHQTMGVGTVVDECQSIAHITYERLRQGRQVDIVCADDALLAHMRKALALYGIEVSPLKPATYQNPLIRLARGGILWHGLGSTEERDDLIRDMMKLPFMVGLSAEQAHMMRQTITHEYATLDPLHALVAQLKTWESQRHAIAWVWAQSPIPIDIRDSWLRDYHAWLERVREIDSILAPTDFALAQRIQLYTSIDALPAQVEALYRSTLPLSFHTQIGAAAATDCVVVMGMSEHVGPRPAFGYQLFSEDTLCDVFVPACRPAAPALVGGDAWREREARRMARLVGTHAQELIITFSQHAANGQVQLPSPYFERIGYDCMEFRRDGTLVVDTNQITVLASQPLPLAQQSQPVPEAPIPLLHSSQFSASQISNYLQCPRRYFYERVLRLAVDDEELDERALSMGSLVHEILCAAVGNGQLASVDLRNEPPTVTQARWADMYSRVMHIAQAAWEGSQCTLNNGDVYSASKTWKHHFGPGLRQQSNLHKLVNICQRWLESDPCMQSTTHRRPVLLEQQLQIRIGGYVINGRIDRIDAIMDAQTGTTHYHIIDYKSGAKKSYSDIMSMFMPTTNESASNYQIPLYLYGTSTPEWLLTPAATAMSLMFVQGNSEDMVIRTVTLSDSISSVVMNKRSQVGITLNRLDLHQMIQRDVVDVMRNMQHYPYPTKPSRSCNYCAYTIICDDAMV